MKILHKRRRLENRTNYTKRKNLLEGEKPRIVVRKSNKYITVQYIESKAAQDTVKVSVNSRELLEQGWSKDKAGSLKSLSAAYLTGLLFGKKIKDFDNAILDTGLIRSTKSSRVYAVVKGIIDSGVEIPCNEEVLPTEEDLKNEKTQDIFEKVKLNIEKSK